MAKKKIDLSRLSLADLNKLAKDIDKAMVDAEATSRQVALAAAEKAAQKHGFALKDLMGGKPKRRTPKAAAAPKYRHPENPAVTWSGRGRQPVWFKEAIASGTKPEKLAI